MSQPPEHLMQNSRNLERDGIPAYLERLFDKVAGVDYTPEELAASIAKAQLMLDEMVSREKDKEDPPVEQSGAAKCPTCGQKMPAKAPMSY